MKVVLIVLACVLVLGLAGCGYLWYMFEGPRKWPTVKGVESPEVIAGINGEVAFTPGGEAAIQAVGEPKARTIFTGTEEVRSQTIAGPDQDGRVALVDNDMMAKRHGLRIISPDGKVKTIFERPGDALWGDFNTNRKPISENIAMSPEGKIAILVNMKARQFSQPAAYLEEGTLEIWNAEGKEVNVINLPCLDSGISWFPDNRYLAVVRATDVNELRKETKWPTGFATTFKDSQVPAVWVIDTETGKGKLLCVGDHPVVSQDAKCMSVEDESYNVEIVELISRSAGAAAPANLPGQYGNVIGITSDRRIIYWGLATEGTKVQSTKNNGLPGPRPMLTIKIVDLKSGKFATIVPAIDPRSTATFGFLR